MNNNISIPVIEMPAIALIKEVSEIDNDDLINSIFDTLFRNDIHPVLISPNPPQKQGIDYLKVPEFMFSNDISIYRKIIDLKNFINESTKERNYDITIIDTHFGLLQHDENEMINYFPLEIMEAIKPDYVIAQVLAEDYIDFKFLHRQLELKARIEINAFVISKTFFDIVKYRENGVKRFISFEDNTIEKLANKVISQINVPIYSRNSINDLCTHIMDSICVDMGDCRKVGEL